MPAGCGPRFALSVGPSHHNIHNYENSRGRSVTLLVIFVVLVFAYSLISGVVERGRLTAPIIFTFAGAMSQLLVNYEAPERFSADVFLTIAELGLVLLLFTDGSRIVYAFRGVLLSVPGRLLSTGMLLTIVFGLLAALLLFDKITMWEAGIIAAVLAPTDAGLGQPIVSNPKVPQRIREGLNVEAGLNDGLAVPFLLFFMAMASQTDEANFSRFFVEQFGYGVLIGLFVGRVGSELFAAAINRGWLAREYRQLGFAALPIMCMLISHETGASMFIAAFVGGLAVRRQRPVGISGESVKFIEDWGQLINLAVFFLFGAIVAISWPHLHWAHFAYAAPSLTVVRMVPVAIAMAGLGFAPNTLVFMGWFGPRGLASIVLGLVYIGHGNSTELVRMCIVATVLSSILLHGLTARRGAEFYAAKVEKLPPDAAEKAPASLERT